MSQSPLPADIFSLPVPQRLELIEKLWESIAAQPEHFELSEAQRAELDRRLEIHHQNPQLGKSWEELKSIIQDD